MSHAMCHLPGIFLVLVQSNTPTPRFSTYRNCTCVAHGTIQYPIVDLSDFIRRWQDRTKMKDFISFLVQEGIIVFFIDDEEEAYALNDSFHDE
ncbi:hypothetical protein C8R48DRAFT_781318 [Suillus tomentosus]|nr:hypothetical protein C8R48DRAFT_781318 [Suillus tomentosus]